MLDVGNGWKGGMIQSMREVSYEINKVGGVFDCESEGVTQHAREPKHCSLDQ